MSLRSLIVDDEPLARRRLRALLKAEPDVQVIGEAEDGPAAVAAIRALSPDLVFLDVQMPGIDGFDVIEEIGVEAAPAVVFVTAHDQYALRAFDAHAVDYLLKPFDRARLKDAVSRAMKLAAEEAPRAQLAALLRDALSHRPLRRLIVRARGRITFVLTAEIDWIEAAGHYVTVHAGREAHLIRDTIANLAARLNPARFARIERGTIVNLDRVKELQPSSHGDFDVVLKDGTRLKATRSYARALK